ncbi:MAG: family 16 glycosylhydrolase [Myxococcota bacterium]|nr:family 16 glycosylhydrolase [Myxococcota bacterium]
MNRSTHYAAIVWLAGWAGCADTPSAPPVADAAPFDAGQVSDVSQAAPDRANPPVDSGPPMVDAAWIETDTGADPTPADAGATPEEPVNLLRNPGFEDGAAPWSVWGGAEIVRSRAHEGERSLQVTRVNGAEQRVEDLEPNTIYRLTGWARTDNPDHPISIGAKDHGNPEVRVLFTEDAYSERFVEFTTGFGATSATVYAYKHTGDSLAHADSLSLVRVGPAYGEAVWADEFDGVGSPDPTRWDFEEGFVRNEELQWYQRENAFQEDGYLILEGRRANRANPRHVAGSNDWRTRRATIDYTSASIRTRDRFDWMYGRLVVRAKVTNATGTWPAIWTLGVDCPWPSNGEVDVMENYGGDILANFAWGTHQRWSPRWDSSRTPVASVAPNWTERFHIWELDWTEDRMAIYLDGQLLNDRPLNNTVNGSAECAGDNPFRQRHYLLLNLALGSNGGSVERLAFPTRYVIDYVRIYQ